MTLSNRILTSCLLIVFTASTIGSTLLPSKLKADTFQVVFDNRTNETVKITLTGPATITFTLEPGKNKKNVPGGNYSYSYRSCSKQVSGKFLVNSAGDSLRIPRCVGGGSVGQTGNAQVLFINGTNETTTVTFSGPERYICLLPNLANQKIELKPGNYTYTFFCVREISNRLASVEIN